MRPDPGAFLEVSDLSWSSIPGAFSFPFLVLTHASFCQLGIEVASICRFRRLLLLLLFQSCGIELAVRSGGSLVTAFGRFTVLRLLGLLLLRKALEEIGNFVNVFVA